MSIPTIHLNAADRSSQVAVLRDACLSHGFFYLDGHGVDDATFAQVLQQSKALFDLPEEVKQTLRDTVLSRGYTAYQEETLDPAVQGNQGDTKEGYYIADDILPGDPQYNPQKLMGPNIWPTVETTSPHLWSQEQCDQFRVVMEQYYQTMCHVGLQVVRLLALAIGVEEHYFDDYFITSPPRAALRLLHYPPVPSQPEHGLLGCGAHSDYGMITLLWTDGTPGLQILPKGNDNNNEWMDIPPPPSYHMLIVNLGDMLERWTNGMFASTKHRVVVVSNKQQHRYSIPFFYEPHFDTVVACIPTCCSDERPARYPPVVSGEYLLNKYQQTHADFTPVLDEKDEEPQRSGG